MTTVNSLYLTSRPCRKVTTYLRMDVFSTRLHATPDTFVLIVLCSCLHMPFRTARCRRVFTAFFHYRFACLLRHYSVVFVTHLPTPDVIAAILLDMPFSATPGITLRAFLVVEKEKQPTARNADGTPSLHTVWINGWLRQYLTATRSRCGIYAGSTS